MHRFSFFFVYYMFFLFWFMRVHLLHFDVISWLLWDFAMKNSSLKWRVECSAGTSLNEPLPQFLTTFSFLYCVSYHPQSDDFFCGYSPASSSLLTPLPPNPFCCDLLFTPIYKAFHYQWSPFTPSWCPFTPWGPQSESLGVVCVGCGKVRHSAAVTAYKNLKWW